MPTSRRDDYFDKLKELGWTPQVQQLQALEYINHGDTRNTQRNTRRDKPAQVAYFAVYPLLSSVYRLSPLEFRCSNLPLSFIPLMRGATWGANTRLPDICRKHWIEWYIKQRDPLLWPMSTGIRSPTGEEARGWFIACPLTPRQMLTLPIEFVWNKLEKCGQMAQEVGAGILGLGAFTVRRRAMAASRCPNACPDSRLQRATPTRSRPPLRARGRRAR